MPHTHVRWYQVSDPDCCRCVFHFRIRQLAYKNRCINNFADTIFKFIKLNIYLRVIRACHQIRLRRRYHDAALTIGSEPIEYSCELARFYRGVVSH